MRCTWTQGIVRVRADNFKRAVICAFLGLALPACFFSRFSAEDVVAAAEADSRHDAIEPVDLKELRTDHKAPQAEGSSKETEPRLVRRDDEESVDTQEESLEMGEYQLDLSTLRQSVLKNSLELKVAVAQRDFAAQGIVEGEGSFDWVLGASATIGESEASAEDVVSGRSQSETLGIDLSIPLKTGTIVELGPSIGHTRNESSAFNDNYFGGFGFSVTQPLLRGAGVGPNTATLQVAKLNTAVANSRAKLTAIQLLAQAERAYWDLYGAEEGYKVQLRQYELAQDFLSYTKKYVESGFAAEIEVLRAEAGLRSRKEAVIVADSTLKRAERFLKRLLFHEELPIHSSRALRAITPPRPQELKLDRKRLFEIALERRMDLFAEELRVLLADIEIEKSQNDLLPRVDLVSAFSYLGTESEDLLRAWKQIGKESDAPTTWSLGLEFSFPIQNNTAQAQLEKARLQKMQRELAQHHLRRQIEQEVYDAVDILEETWARIEAASLASEAAGKTYEAEKKQFQRGVITSTELLEAVGNLSRAQIREVRAIVDHQKARIGVALATGTVLGLNRIQWGAREEAAK